MKSPLKALSLNTVTFCGPRTNLGRGHNQPITEGGGTRQSRCSGQGWKQRSPQQSRADRKLSEGRASLWHPTPLPRLLVLGFPGLKPRSSALPRPGGLKTQQWAGRESPGTTHAGETGEEGQAAQGSDESSGGGLILCSGDGERQTPRTHRIFSPHNETALPKSSRFLGNSDRLRRCSSPISKDTPTEASQV